MKTYKNTSKASIKFFYPFITSNGQGIKIYIILNEMKGVSR